MLDGPRAQWAGSIGGDPSKQWVPDEMNEITMSRVVPNITVWDIIGIPDIFYLLKMFCIISHQICC